MPRSNRQRQILQAMGIDQWVPRDQISASDTLESNQPQAQQEIDAYASEDVNGTATPVSPAHVNLETKTKSRSSVAQKQTIAELQQATSAKTDDVVAPVTIVKPDEKQISQIEWPELQTLVSGCTGCDLHQKRTQTVFGNGDQQADWLIIGEAPGQQEDLLGEPFVGRAGTLLNNMLLAAGQPREKVYIANVVKCRPPGNRDPKPEETSACQAYLRRQVALLKPSLILVVGRIAAQSLLETTVPVGKLRGQVHHFPDSQIPMIVTYHPAYLLRRPSEKAKSWDDLKLAMRTYSER